MGKELIKSLRKLLTCDCNDCRSNREAMSSDELHELEDKLEKLQFRENLSEELDEFKEACEDREKLQVSLKVVKTLSDRLTMRNRQIRDLRRQLRK